MWFYKTCCCCLFLFLAGCSSQEPKVALVSVSDTEPVIDGEVDACWKELPVYPIDGTLGGEINWDGAEDLYAEFRVLMHANDLFFLVKVTDDIKGKIDDSMMSQYWENDNVEFFFTNASKLAQIELSKQDTIYFFNFSIPYDRLEKMGNLPESKSKYVSFDRQDFEGGYFLEDRFEQELGIFDLEKGTMPFNIGLSDNDNLNNEEGFIKGSESGISWGYNSGSTSWKETINYGDLVMDR